MKKFSFGELKIMVNKINIGIVGYGNLGRAVEKALMNNDDLKLEAIFTRRNTKNIISNSKLLHISEMKNYIGSIDVMILCGGSATDLPQQSAEIAKYFNVVDSFDTHAKIEEHFREVDEVCKENKKIALLSVGWDPGLFSLNRLLGKAIIPNSTEYTFWGKGVSQGHSDAIRRIKGVKMAIQYTIPIKEVIEKVRGGEKPILSDGKMHKRVWYVVAEEGLFYNCYSLSSLVIPSGIKSIGINTFYNCYSAGYYDFSSHTFVPTLLNYNAFTGIPSDCKIRVPTELYDKWILASNWSKYTDYIEAV